MVGSQHTPMPVIRTLASFLCHPFSMSLEFNGYGLDAFLVSFENRSRQLVLQAKNGSASE
jgi:hypothetical protein